MPKPAKTLIELTTEIVSAHVTNHKVTPCELPALIRNVHDALRGLGGNTGSAATGPRPAVPVSASVRPDYIVCLEDGKKLQTLKRYLMTHYQMTPEEYRAKWNLSRNYPMAAPSYAAKRRAVAMRMGLGGKWEEKGLVAAE